MENQTCRLHDINGDLLEDVMARVDGLSLASVACAASDLRGVARNQSLWKQLCHSTWPSTALEEAQQLILPSGFDKFYANCFPLILYDKDISGNSAELPGCPKPKAPISPSDFVSLVDVYYKSKCVLSRILDGIPEAVDIFEYKPVDNNWDMTANERQRWFLNCPFKLDLLAIKYDDDDNNGNDDGHADNTINNERSTTPSLILMEDGKSGDCSKKLIEDIRLSWILLDKKLGKAVNLSCWKPLSVHRCWPYRRDYAMHFGCIIREEENELPHKLARCKITTRLRMTETEECPQWREINMSIEDLTGSHVNGRSSLMILKQALYSRRSTNRLKVERGFHHYEKQRRGMIRRKEFKETLADRLYMSTEIIVFIVFCYAFAILTW